MDNSNENNKKTNRTPISIDQFKVCRTDNIVNTTPVLTNQFKVRRTDTIVKKHPSIKLKLKQSQEDKKTGKNDE